MRSPLARRSLVALTGALALLCGGPTAFAAPPQISPSDLTDQVNAARTARGLGALPPSGGALFALAHRLATGVSAVPAGGAMTSTSAPGGIALRLPDQPTLAAAAHADPRVWTYVLDPRATAIAVAGGSFSNALGLQLDDALPWTAPLAVRTGVLDPRERAPFVLPPGDDRARLQILEDGRLRTVTSIAASWITPTGARLLKLPAASQQLVAWDATYRIALASGGTAGFTTHTIPAGRLRRGFRFVRMTARQRSAVKAAVAAQRPEARRLVDLLDGQTTIRVRRSAGSWSFAGSGVAGRGVITFDPTHLGPRGRYLRNFVVTHELGHRVEADLLDPAARAEIARLLPGGPCRGCQNVEHERFADTYARWALGVTKSTSPYGIPALSPAALDAFGALVLRRAHLLATPA